MSDDTRNPDAEIIQAAYAERVKEAFKAFAEALAIGENENGCLLRFNRSVQLVKKARDLALRSSAATIVEPTAPHRQTAAADDAGEALSAEFQEMIDHAVDATRGVGAPTPPPTPMRRR